MRRMDVENEMNVAAAFGEIEAKLLEEEQTLVARLVHRMHSDRIEETFSILKLAKDRFQKGGRAKARVAVEIELLAPAKHAQ